MKKKQKKRKKIKEVSLICHGITMIVSKSMII